jgi:hypothetical protein
MRVYLLSHPAGEWSFRLSNEWGPYYDESNAVNQYWKVLMYLLLAKPRIND